MLHNICMCNVVDRLSRGDIDIISKVVDFSDLPTIESATYLYLQCLSRECV